MSAATGVPADGAAGICICTFLPLEPDEIEMVGGILVTSVARTIADLARVIAFEEAVVCTDSALFRSRKGLGHRVGRSELRTALVRAPRRHGTAAAGRVFDFATDLSESVGESRSRVAIRVAGLPPPELQVVLHSAEGRPLGRVDFWWEKWGVVGEFDGRVKYGRLLRPGQSVDRAPVTRCSRRRCARTPCANRAVASCGGRGLIANPPKGWRPQIGGSWSWCPFFEPGSGCGWRVSPAAGVKAGRRPPAGLGLDRGEDGITLGSRERGRAALCRAVCVR
jgi:hypothetical protein